MKRITVNLAPADLRKEGSLFDLPIAIGILAATGQVPPEQAARHIIVGELSLDGTVCAVPGIILMAGDIARERPGTSFIVPLGNLAEASLVPGLQVCGGGHLAEIVSFLRGEREITAGSGYDEAKQRALSSSDAGRWTRFRGGQRPGTGQAGPGNSGSRRPQHPPGGAAGHGQDDARPPAALHPAADDLGGVPGGHQDLQRGRAAAQRQPRHHRQAVPGAPPYGLCGQHHRRGQQGASRRDQPRLPRRPVPGRTAGVQPGGAGGPAGAAGGERGHRRPGCQAPLPIRPISSSWEA